MHVILKFFNVYYNVFIDDSELKPHIGNFLDFYERNGENIVIDASVINIINFGCIKQ